MVVVWQKKMSKCLWNIWFDIFELVEGVDDGRKVVVGFEKGVF